MRSGPGAATPEQHAWRRGIGGSLLLRRGMPWPHPVRGRPQCTNGGTGCSASEAHLLQRRELPAVADSGAARVRVDVRDVLRRRSPVAQRPPHRQRRASAPRRRLANVERVPRRPEPEHLRQRLLAPRGRALERLKQHHPCACVYVAPRSGGHTRRRPEDAPGAAAAGRVKHVAPRSPWLRASCMRTKPRAPSGHVNETRAEHHQQSS